MQFQLRIKTMAKWVFRKYKPLKQFLTRVKKSWNDIKEAQQRAVKSCIEHVQNMIQIKSAK